MEEEEDSRSATDYQLLDGLQICRGKENGDACNVFHYRVIVL